MRSLKSTTALAVALSLSLPAPTFAQGQGLAKGLAKQLARDIGLEMCEKKSGPVPCVTSEGTLLIEAPSEGLPACGDGALPCVTKNGFVEVGADSELAIQAIEQHGSDATAPETAEQAEPEAQPAEEAPADAATAEPEQTEEVPAAEEPVQAEAAPEAGQDATVAEDAAPVEETQSEQAAPEQQATEAAPTEEAPAEEVTEAPAAEETPAETQEATATDEPAAESEETVVIEEAPAAAAAAETVDGDASADAEAEVATEEVTEETARSASEDFKTSAKGATAEATAAAEKDKGGLSNFEKALLLGLGTLAVGAVLNNGDEIVSNSGDRVVLKDDTGNLRVLKDDDVLLRQPGSQVRTETFNDGSTRTTVTRDDGTKIVTIRAADGRVVYRVRELSDGSRVVLFDDTEASEPVRVSELPKVETRRIDVNMNDEEALRRALAEADASRVDRSFSLRQIRQIAEVRTLAPEIELDAITFDTGSAAIRPSQAEELSALGRAMARIIEDRPNEVFLIEGHTDAVGDAGYNLALSDRRAETVALALTEYFDVPPENMITQGYGESELKIPTQDAERQNRRAVVRRITPLLRQASLN